MLSFISGFSSAVWSRRALATIRALPELARRPDSLEPNRNRPVASCFLSTRLATSALARSLPFFTLVMGEAWDDLGVLRTQRDQCARDVSQLMDACARDHPENKHVIECRECFEKVIDRMRSRYLEPRDDAPREWFSGRAGLLKELDELFLAVREYKRDLDKVDTRLDTERKQWYEQQLRASPSIRKTIEELLDRKKVFADIGTKGLGFEETVAEVREALESPGLPKSEVREEEAGKTLDRLVAASTPEAKLQVYKEAFFQGDPEEQVSEKVRSYMDRLQNGATMDQIINTISMDRRSSIGAQSQKEQHRQRVEELRRAKNAHELQKQKKASGRKDSNQKPQPPDEMYDQPPCHACGRELDLQDYMACALCQVLVDNGVRTKPTLFCSSACFSGQDGQVSLPDVLVSLLPREGEGSSPFLLPLLLMRHVC